MKESGDKVIGKQAECGPSHKVRERERERERALKYGMVSFYGPGNFID